jgi:hypothetical protein
MQIAVCISGAERLYSHALTLFMRKLPASAMVDCFCFFWEGGMVDEEGILAEAVERKAEGRFRNVFVKIGRNFVNPFNLVVEHYPETNIENTLRMFTAIRRCNDMKLLREIKDNFVYDCVVRTRSDLCLSSDVELERFLPFNHEFIVFPENGHWRGGLNDQFAFSSSNNMDSYSSVIDHIPDHCGNGCVFHPEILLRYHILKMRKYPILAPINAYVMRDESL